MRALLDRLPVDFESLDRLLPGLPVECAEVLLDALAESDDRMTRRKLLDRLAAMAHDIEPALEARLDDERWYVQRNMLVLFERRHTLPSVAALAQAAAHPDVRVRQEAIRLQLRIPGERDAAVRAALDSGHTGLAHAALAAIQQDCPVHLVDRVGRGRGRSQRRRDGAGAGGARARPLPGSTGPGVAAGADRRRPHAARARSPGTAIRG